MVCGRWSLAYLVYFTHSYRWTILFKPWRSHKHLVCSWWLLWLSQYAHLLQCKDHNIWIHEISTQNRSCRSYTPNVIITYIMKIMAYTLTFFKCHNKILPILFSSHKFILKGRAVHLLTWNQLRSQKLPDKQWLIFILS